MPAMVVNDNAGKPDKRGALESIAGKPAPTGFACFPGLREEPFFLITTSLCGGCGAFQGVICPFIRNQSSERRKPSSRVTFGS